MATDKQISGKLSPQISPRNSQDRSIFFCKRGSAYGPQRASPVYNARPTGQRESSYTRKPLQLKQSPRRNQPMIAVLHQKTIPIKNYAPPLVYHKVSDIKNKPSVLSPRYPGKENININLPVADEQKIVDKYWAKLIKGANFKQNDDHTLTIKTQQGKGHCSPRQFIIPCNKSLMQSFTIKANEKEIKKNEDCDDEGKDKSALCHNNITTTK